MASFNSLRSRREAATLRQAANKTQTIIFVSIQSEVEQMKTKYAAAVAVVLP